MLTKSLKLVSLSSLSLLLLFATVVFAALPLRVIRKHHGRLVYWVISSLMIGLLLGLGFDGLSLGFCLQAFAVGFYSELEGVGFSVFESASLSLLLSIGVGSVGVAGWILRTKLNLTHEIMTFSKSLVVHLHAVDPALDVTEDVVARQLPSAAIIVLASSLALALIFEKRLMRWWRIDHLNMFRQRVSTYKVPDFFVWAFILSLIGGFLIKGQPIVETVSLNVLNLLVVVYFFQGIAIVANFFEAQRLSYFWRGFWFVLLVFQLFLLVSLVGLADYWLNFRERFSKKTKQINKFI